MLYYIFNYLYKCFHIPGLGVFKYISFRAALSAVLSLIIAIRFGGVWIRYCNSKQVNEKVRKLGLPHEVDKNKTPTMGGVLIILSVFFPTLLLARLDNVYIILLLVSLCLLGIIGWVDDYIKVYRSDKKGLSGWFKIVGQIILGIIVGTTLYFNPKVTIRVPVIQEKCIHVTELATRDTVDIKSSKTTIPFLKNNELDYSCFLPDSWSSYTVILYIIVVLFVITAMSNGVNLTDGLDGLAAGTSAIVGVTLAILAYLSGNIIFANYLNIMYIPQLGELVVFCTAFVGACIGFLWYNAYPAQIFMGDTGSLTLGGLIAVIAFMIRKELLLPLLCGVFFVESLSVILQVGYFKYTKRRYGTGRRVFLMAPLHHHYQKLGWHESKIVVRVWITGIILAIVTLATLKLR